MIIGIDVDGVLCDLHTPWLAAYNADYEDTLRAEDCAQYDLAPLTKPACGRKIYDYLNKRDLYKDAPAIDGALEVVLLLKASGHRVVYVTSTGRTLHAQKRQWLEDHGFLDDRGHAPHDDLVYMSDKGLFRADVLLEDNPKQLERFQGHRLLLNRPWNYAYLWSTPGPEPTRVDWNTVLPTIDRLTRGAVPETSVLLEAQGLVHGPRNIDYGSPLENDTRIANLMRALFGWPVEPTDIWQIMVLTKLSRERVRPKRDNRTDTAGYAEVGDWIHRELGT